MTHNLQQQSITTALAKPLSLALPDQQDIYIKTSIIFGNEMRILYGFPARDKANRDGFFGRAAEEVRGEVGLCRHWVMWGGGEGC